MIIFFRALKFNHENLIRAEIIAKIMHVFIPEADWDSRRASFIVTGESIAGDAIGRQRLGA